MPTIPSLSRFTYIPKDLLLVSLDNLAQLFLCHCFCSPGNSETRRLSDIDKETYFYLSLWIVVE